MFFWCKKPNMAPFLVSSYEQLVSKKTDIRYDLTRFKLNLKTLKRPGGGPGGKSWAVSEVERSATQCQFCRPQNFTVIIISSN